MNATNQKRCESRYRLQIDHIKPIALGGKTEIKNLRHLCQAHNLRMAAEMGNGNRQTEWSLAGESGIAQVC